MNVLVDNADLILRGFRTTLALTALSGVLALALGTALAAIRVSPVAALRWFGTTYVTVVRNTPLVVLLIVFVFGLPELGFQFSFFVRAVIGLTVYTAAFVCEVLRSGINAVQPGQAEAARAVGMTFGQTLREIVLPQAFRTVVPPLGSVFIALTKNTAIAEAFGVTEATYVMDSLIRDFPGALYALFFGIAAGYIVIVLGISAVFRAIERNVLVLR